MPRTIFEDIVIKRYEEASALAFCQYTPIRFFEILFIEKGKGELIINGHKVAYNDNQIFIFIPNDKYNFKIEEPTTVSAIKFLNNFFANFLVDNNNKEQRKKWFKKIETILHSANRTSEVKFASKNEEISISSLFTVLCNEYNDNSLKNESVLKATLHAILHILSRNVNYINTKTPTSKIQDIINYLHYNIHDSEKLSKKSLATQFNISENYVSQYFKREMGVGLKNYILNYKITLAETRLTHTDLTVSEIASELGFTDSSHLDKTFVSYKKFTTGAYRTATKNND